MSFVSWKDILSSSAVITTVVQFLSGTLICHNYIQKKSTGDSSGFPFVCGFLSCSLWLKYGFLTNEHSVILVNAIGATLFFSYIAIFYVFTVNKKTIIRQLAMACFFLVSAIAYTQYEKDVTKSTEIMGYLCCGVTVVFFAAPLTKLIHVIKVKSSESLPFPLILTSFFVTLQWFIYGNLIGDKFLQIPNFLGCILSASQLSLFYCYPSRAGPAYTQLDQTVVF